MPEERHRFFLLCPPVLCYKNLQQNGPHVTEKVLQSR
jgi:hypothetical protein